MPYQDNVSRRSVVSTLGVTGLVGVTGLATQNASGAEQDQALKNVLATDKYENLVGAHYYPWYGTDPVVHWDEGYWGNPLIGEYDSQEEGVINQHIAWALNNGINWFNVAWWGPNSYSGQTMENDLMEASLADAMNFSVLYETVGQLGAPDQIDFTDPETREQFVSDFVYLQENLFNRENYLRINDRPVVYIYIARVFDFFNDTEDVIATIEEARAAIDDNPYIIADLGIGPNPDAPVLEVYDAVGRYDVYSRAEDWETVFERNLSGYQEYYNNAQDAHFDFIPAVSPGFHHTERPELPVLERSQKVFQEFCSKIPPLMDDNLRAVLITSFNEWHEGTIVEPGKDEAGNNYSFDYLQIIKEELQQRSTEGKTA